MDLVHHHIHKRKQTKEDKKKRLKAKKFIDKLVYVAAAFGPIMTVPQVVQIYVHQSAAGVSAITWGAYLVCAIIWLAYGIIHDEKPIIFTNSTWIFLDFLIGLGAIMYG